MGPGSWSLQAPLSHEGIYADNAIADLAFKKNDAAEDWAAVERLAAESGRRLVLLALTKVKGWHHDQVILYTP